MVTVLTNISHLILLKLIFVFVSTSMLKTLERYQKCNYGAPEPNVSTRDALVIFYLTLNFSLLVHDHIHLCFQTAKKEK